MIELGGGGLSVADYVLDEKSFERGALGLVGAVLGNDQEGEGGDGIGISRGAGGLTMGMRGSLLS